MQELLQRIKDNVIQGRVDAEDEGIDGGMEGQPGVTELVREALEQKVDPKEILLAGLTPGMEEVGRQYETGEFLIPDMLAAAECVGAAMEILKPHLAKENVASKGRFVIATVEGDLHDIGKNIVATMLRGSGYDVRDLGVGVPAARIVEAVRETEAQFLGLSALLTTTMPQMKLVVDGLREAGLRDGVTIFLGGAPISAEFTASIGADHYCRDAFGALGVLKAG